ncbi:MAG TPA: aldehyde dehydrogenase family protein [Vicinamibacterales bacterium]|jgi:glyceraldehyde-3-phosphate dehydrogenase (NADP+)
MGTSAASRLGDFGILLHGTRVETGSTFDVRSPYDGSLVATVHSAGAAEIERAIAAAARSFETTRRLPSWKRAAVLERIAAAVAQRRDEFAETIALEAGKPIALARVEVDRAAFVLRVGAEEARRITGEILPLDWLPGTEGREALVRRVPLGPIVGITPFNFPVNLVAHKVAPALAAGNPLILRPGPRTPVSALLLGRLILDAGWPPDALAVFPCSNDDTLHLVEDDRIKLLTFTGSAPVGWMLKSRAGRKRVTLELGGNAAVIVHADADAGHAAERVASGGFAYAGQSCISAQRIYVHAAIYDAFSAAIVARARALKIGDPLDESTDVGPVIDAAAADRIGEWIDEARAAGAVVLTGGVRHGSVWEPTVIEGAPATARVNCRELFGPVVSLTRYDEIGQAIAAANDSEFGLQAGIFSHDQRVIDAAIDGIDAGGIIVNDSSAFRVDHMPYGGVKQSGLGREGVRYAIEEMTESKLVAYTRRR